MVGSGEPERLEGQLVSPTISRRWALFRHWGATSWQPTISSRDRISCISATGCGERHFAGDPQIIGRKITLDNNPYTVIGVMPAPFENVLAPGAQLWSPLQYDPSLPSDGREWGHHLQMVGRLRPGVSRRERKRKHCNFEGPGPAYAKGTTIPAAHPHAMVVNRLQDDCHARCETGALPPSSVRGAAGAGDGVR